MGETGGPTGEDDNVTSILEALGERLGRVVPDPADERTTALGLWRYSFDYLKAANIVDKHDPNPWVESQVTYQLVCQGLELALKAYLRATGQTVRDLIRTGHSLEKCLNSAERAGLTPLCQELRAALLMIDRYYKQNEF